MKRFINLLILQILTFVSFSQTRTTSGDAIRKEITPKYVNGVIKQLTIAQLKAQAIINGDSTTLYYVIDTGKKGYFELDKNDNTSTGNDSTIIVTNNGKRLKRTIEQYLAPSTTGKYYRGDKTWQDLNKSSVGLSNVDNTSDLNKPISTVTQTALLGKLDKGYSISELRGLSNSVLAATQIFYCSESGKEGFWKYDASDNSGSDNLGAILVTSGGKRLKRIIENNVLYPEWFGAKGDSTQDDRQYLQSAMNYAGANNIPIFLRGIYIISDQLDINYSNFKISGTEYAKITGDIFYGIVIKNVKNISIDRLSIISTKVADYSSGESGAPAGAINGGLISCYPTNGYTVENINISNCFFSSQFGSVNAIKLIANRNNIGGKIQKVNIINCNFENIGRMAIEVLGSSIANRYDYSNICIYNCKFKNIGVKSVYGMAVSFSGNGSLNKVENCSIDGCKDIALENAGASYTEFQKNSIKAATGIAITIQSLDDGIIKMGNKCISNYTQDTISQIAAYIYNQKDLLFSDNTINSIDRGVAIGGVSYSVFSKNKIHTLGQTTNDSFGSSLFLTSISSTSNTFTSNTYSNSSTTWDCVYISSTSTNNVFDGNFYLFVNSTTKKPFNDNSGGYNYNYNYNLGPSLVNFSDSYLEKSNLLKIGGYNFFLNTNGEILYKNGIPSSASDGKKLVVSGSVLSNYNLGGAYYFSTNRVTIGSSTDFGYNLNVDGSFNARGDALFGGSVRRLTLSPTTTEFKISGLDGVPINFYQSSTNVLTISTNNRIGVGTASPSQKMHVAGSVAIDDKIVFQTGTNKSVGTLVLASGLGTITSTAITTNSIIWITTKTLSGTSAHDYTYNISADGTATITARQNNGSTETGCNSTIQYWIIN